MNKPTRHLAVVIIVMFISLMVAATYIQFFSSGALSADERNVRTLYHEYGTERGKIIVDGHAIASSVPATDSVYKFQRTYEDPLLYSHITGYFSTTFNSMTGMERAENSVLGGSDSSLATQRLQELITGAQPQGGSVELTIDPVIQKAAVQALAGQKGAVVALDPSTGAILAQVSSPAFDTNALASSDSAVAKKAWDELNADPAKPLIDRSIGGDQYAPGSVFKLVTTVAILENNPELNAHSVIEAPQTWTAPDTTEPIGNHNNSQCGNGSGQVSLQTAFIESCNTPFAILGTHLGGETLVNQAERFGFGKSFTTPLTVQPSRNPMTTTQAGTAMDAIGQNDVMVTPMQMAMVTSAIANKGVLMKPYLVRHVYTADLELVSTTTPSLFGQTMSENTAAVLQDMMIETVRSGTGTQAGINGVDVAGKTGTAETGSAPHSWFVAYAPADKPAIALAVVVENSGFAGDNGSGGSVAAPIAKHVIQAGLTRTAQ